MRSVIFTYGRFNPPHKGHRQMINRIINEANKTGKTPVVVVSHSHGNIKNPLTVANKVKILRNWYPNLEIMSSASNRSIAAIAKNFSPDSRMVVGWNRKNQFRFLPVGEPIVLNRANNAPSATKARAAAMNGNANAFKNVTGYNLTNNILKKVRTSAATTKSITPKPKRVRKPK